MKNKGMIWFLVSAIFGLYFINFAFEFVTLPNFIINMNKWIILGGGVLIIIGGMNSLRAKPRRYHKDY